MLIKCPECELQVSDRAISCPHCGYPMKTTPAAPAKKRTYNKRRRLPNGFGQISEIKNRNLRKPFRAMVTVGKTEEGRPICKPLKPISYFATYNEAYEALIENNKNPYVLSEDITVKELYERWSKIFFEEAQSDSPKMRTKAAWQYCSALYDCRITDLTPGLLKDRIESASKTTATGVKHPSANTKKNMKTLFKQMLDYALEYDLVDRNAAKSFSLAKKTVLESQKTQNGHISYTDEEMRILWDNLYKIDYVDMLLIQCYSGWRPQELCNLRLENINLEEWTFKGGMKTAAGRDRVVPIHTRIRPLVEKRYEESSERGSEYLFTKQLKNGTVKHISFKAYIYVFQIMVEKLKINPDHRPHDGKKQFVTMAKKYKVDEYAIKYIAGHKIKDLTERVYTDRDPEWLSEEIEKIK